MRQLPIPANWLRLARLARMLSWLTLAWMGIEGGVAIAGRGLFRSHLSSVIVDER